MYIWSIDVGHVRIGLAILEVADCHLGNIKRYIQHRKKRNHIDKMKWENVKIVSMQTFSAWDTDVSARSSAFVTTGLARTRLFSSLSRASYLRALACNWCMTYLRQ